MAPTMLFHFLIAAVATLAGAIAAVVGFGIGSLLTPLLGLEVGLKLAVALVAVPHAIATATRFWLLRRHVDKRVLLGFGLASAAGGLVGALLHGVFASRGLTYLLAALLIFVGVSGWTGLTARMRFEGVWAWLAGILSGGLGGLVGNQGGIRSGAMLGMGVEKTAFVGTATAIGLMVDAARLPVYLYTSSGLMAAHWMPIAIASVGVLLGTFLGERLLRRLPESAFRHFVATLVLVLGLVLLIHPE
ncbi:MAG TPA: sulfite exporter TauE/SafE family protein [Oscillatoriaceae cyanobacterium]